MRIVVTGGAGFIGSNFLNLMVPRHPDHQFINVDALTYAANLRNLSAIDARPNYAFERVDIADYGAVEALFEQAKPDVVVHFAAESHVDRSIAGPRAFLRSNVEGTFNLLEAARHRLDGDALFHHVSTDEVYGSLGPTGLFTEDSRYDPSSPYAASKAASDHLVRSYGRTFGLRVRITNCSNNYGPYQFPEKLIPLMITNLLAGQALPIYGEGLNVRDWLYVDDHCEAIWAVLESGKDGETYNIGGHNEVTNIDVVRALIALVAQEASLPQAKLESLVTHVRDRPGHDQRYAIDAGKIGQELGWQPAETFTTGLRKTVRWYLDNRAWVEEVRSGDYRKWIEQNYTAR